MALLYGATASDGWRFAEAFRAAVATQGFPGESTPAPRAHHRERRRRDLPRSTRRTTSRSSRPPTRASIGPRRPGATAPSARRREAGEAAAARGRRRARPRARRAPARRPARSRAPSSCSRPRRARPAATPQRAPPRFVLLEGRPGVRGRAPRASRPVASRRAKRWRSRSAPTPCGSSPASPRRSVALGRRARRGRALRFGDEPPVEVSLVSGRPRDARAAPRPRARSPPSSPSCWPSTTRACVPYAPASYAMRRARGRLAGGCRALGLRLPDRRRRSAPSGSSRPSEAAGLADGSGAGVGLRRGDKRYVSPCARSCPASSP